jgi:hypothetical protein
MAAWYPQRDRSRHLLEIPRLYHSIRGDYPVQPSTIPDRLHLLVGLERGFHHPALYRLQ